MISEVQIVPVKPNNGLIGFASLVIDDDFYLCSIGIHSKKDGSGFRLTYPTRKVGGRDLHIFHPITPQISREIESAVFQKCNQILWHTNE